MTESPNTSDSQPVQFGQGESLGHPSEIPYEERLRQDLRFGLQEGGRYFSEASNAHVTMRRFAGRLNELGISYAVSSYLAMFWHGYRRFTETAEFLVSPEGCSRIHAELVGRGWEPKSLHNRHLRDSLSGVEVRLNLMNASGDQTGIGPLMFEDLLIGTMELGGIKFIDLVSLICLKLMKPYLGRLICPDRVDVLEMIKVLDLPLSLAEQLHPKARDEFVKLWHDWQDNRTPLDDEQLGLEPRE